MDWRVSCVDVPKMMAILVSKHYHCLIDLLWRWEAGPITCQDVT
jgi:formyltetrahydrofolate deformylase